MQTTTIDRVTRAGDGEVTMRTVRRHNRGMQISLLQRLLNKHGATPRLREDGAFGARTRAAVIAFQTASRLRPDGVAGPKTWRRLGITIDINHRMVLYGQPTGMTCWSAAATMILGTNMSVGSGSATLSASGGLLPGPANVRRFADSMGWRMHYPQTWTTTGLAGLMRRKPIWTVGGGGTGTGSWLHAIVISALWSDGAADGSGTMLRIHDPWPPNVGSVYGRFYRGTIRGFDFISMYVLEP
jgi:hypothetical protein